MASALDIVLHQARMADGSRKLISLQEITGMEGNVITAQEIFSFQQTAVDNNGKVRGRFRFSGVRPKFVEKFKIAGVPISNDLFDPKYAVEV